MCWNVQIADEESLPPSYDVAIKLGLLPDYSSVMLADASARLEESQVSDPPNPPDPPERWGMGGGREGEEGEEIFHPNRPRKCLQSNRTVCVLRFDPVFTSLIVKSISG